MKISRGETILLAVLFSAAVLLGAALFLVSSSRNPALVLSGTASR